MEELVEKMRTVLTPLEREILEHRYGIGGQDRFPLPLKTVAHEKGCSIEWVRKVEDRATVKLAGGLSGRERDCIYRLIPNLT
jgi:DNA-directed RNA polymerase sigma subunit (sigma70/sigma32)